MKGLFRMNPVASNKMNTDETFSLAYCIVYRSERLPKDICTHILEYMATPANLLKKALRENAEINTEEDLVRVCSERKMKHKEDKKIADTMTSSASPLDRAVNNYIPRDIMLYMLLNKMDLLNKIADILPINRFSPYTTPFNIFQHLYRYRGGNQWVPENKELQLISKRNSLILCPHSMRVDALTPSLIPDISGGEGKASIIQKIDKIVKATMKPHININMDKRIQCVGGWLFKTIRKKYTRLGVKKLYAIWRRTWDEDIYDILGINN